MEKALIIALLIVLVGTVFTFVLAMARHKKDIECMEDAYEYLRKSYDQSLDMLDDINSKYAKSLDERERLLNDMNLMRKKLELEIDKRDEEIANMDKLLGYAKYQNSEVQDEKEEVKKEA
jgi:hypothetical protein